VISHRFLSVSFKKPFPTKSDPVQYIKTTFARQLSHLFYVETNTWYWTKLSKTFSAKVGNILRNWITILRSRRLSCLHIDESLLIFWPAIIERYNNYFRTFLWRCWWSTFLFYPPAISQEEPDLFGHPVFVDGTHDLQQSPAMVAKTRINLPDFFNALTPDQRQDFLRSEIAYDNYFTV